MKQVRPDAFGRPALEPVVQRLARAVGLGRILPPAAGDQNMHNAADDTTIVDPRLTTRVRRQVRFKPCELGVGQPEKISIQQRSPSGNLESRPRRLGNPFYGSQP